jgi:hypothetical protein
MNRTPLKGLLKKTEEKPETTLRLSAAVLSKETTIKTFYFTDETKEQFEDILEKVATGKGGGFWIQAEYGAGKTHFLAALACLLTDMSEELWNKVKNEEIKRYRKRLEKQRLFPILINLKGRAGDNLLAIIEEDVRTVLEQYDLADKITITPKDELINWYKTKAKREVDSFIKEKLNKDIGSVSDDELLQIIQQYCDVLNIQPKIPTSTMKRVSHIYHQIMDLGYTGLLFIIDEYAGWQMLHQLGTPEYALDEEVLETLAWELPRGKGLEIYVVVASTEQTPTKLLGERYKNIPIMKKEEEYGSVVAYRVRELIEEKKPEIEQYHEYYYKEFKFLKNVSKDYFFKIFPFQPRCFEVIKKITARGLPTARVGINVAWEALTDELQSGTSLVTLSDLMLSYSLLNDLSSTSYKSAYDSFNEAIAVLPDYELEPKGEEIAKRVIKTLFLWYIAYMEETRTLSELDIMEATLTAGNLITGEDEIRLILTKIRDINQIEYKKDKGTIFKVTKIGEKRPSQIFTNIKKKNTDQVQIQRHWELGLKLSPSETGGQQSLFSDFEFETEKSQVIEVNKIEYPGTVVLARTWKAEYGEKLKDNQHFRIVFLTNQLSIDSNEIEDERIGICIPGELSEQAKESSRDYWTLLEMEKQYQDQPGSEAEEVREWLTVSRRRDVIRNLLNKQLAIYSSGKICTLQDIGYDERRIFSIYDLSKILNQLVTPLLSDAYSSFPIDTNHFARGKKLASNDPKKLFDGLFKDAGGASASACANFASALFLSEPNNPTKFTPRTNKVFDLIEQRFNEHDEDLPLWKIYDELERSPYGLLRELITLYILCFVARGKPNVEITLKSGGRITTRNIRDQELRARIEMNFDTLSRGIEVSWNEVLPYARVICHNLKTATQHTEVEEQERLFMQSLTILKDQLPTLKQNLDILFKSYNEKLDEKYIQLIENVKKIVNCTSYSQFYEPFRDKEKYSDENIFKAEFEQFCKIKELASLSTELLNIKSYLDNTSLPEKSNLILEKTLIANQIKLEGLIEDANRFEGIKQQFATFQNRYEKEYKIHHRNYYTKINELKNILEDTNEQIKALTLLGRIPNLSIPSEKEVVNEHQLLSQKMSLCELKDPVELQGAPLCPKCKLTMTKEPLEQDVKNFSRKLTKTLENTKSQLFHLLTKEILAQDKENKLKILLQTIQAAQLDSFIKKLSPEIIEYITNLLEKANITTVTSEIFNRLIEKYKFVDEQNIQEVVTAFREELEKAISEAKKKNPRKKIKIILG